MSDFEALVKFNRKRVSNDMVNYLVATTNSIIQTDPSEEQDENAENTPSLTLFIKRLIVHSNVQTPTLMSTLVYLTKLRKIIPSDVVGIETTKHRIFIGCLILAAKTLNDSSPLNKHWTQYTDGLFELCEVNTIERELLEYFNWDVMIKQDDLVTVLSPFLQPIKEQMAEVYQHANKYIPPKVSNSNIRQQHVYQREGSMGHIQRPITPSSSQHSSLYNNRYLPNSQSSYRNVSSARQSTLSSYSRISSHSSIPSLYSSSTIGSTMSQSNYYLPLKSTNSYNDRMQAIAQHQKNMNALKPINLNQMNKQNLIDSHDYEQTQQHKNININNTKPISPYHVPYNEQLINDKENIPIEISKLNKSPSKSMARPLFLKHQSSKSSFKSAISGFQSLFT